MESKKVEMSFRSSPGTTSPKPGASLGDLVEGQKVDGIVKKVEDYGIFITIAGTKLSGLCHKSEVRMLSLFAFNLLRAFPFQVADSKDADVSMALRNFREGDKVKAVILSIDAEKRRVSLGLKPSYFAEDDIDATSENEDVDMDSAEYNGQIDSVINAIGQAEETELDINEDSDDENAIVIESSSTRFHPAVADSAPEQAKSETLAPVLSLQGFQWTNDSIPEDDEPESSSDEGIDNKQSSKRSKKKVIEKDLTADIHTKLPESITDFERLLLASPNSSYMWIQYMAFQLQLAEIDKAREIAKRALNAINIREEQEKLNVWIALLNLENTYGTEDSLDQTFKDATRYNDSKTVHLRLAAILDQSGKSEVFISH